MKENDIFAEKKVISKLKQVGVERSYSDGSIVCLEGDPGNELFVVVSGGAEVSKKISDKKQVLANLVAGDVFGELSVFGGTRRSAMVRAIGKLVVKCIDKASLEKIMDDSAVGMYFLKTISQRLHKLEQEMFKYCTEGGIDAKRAVGFYSLSRGKSRLLTFN
jgi:CRP-like cAMP-binding protein